MTSSRYQSKLFNFFSRQSHRFGDLVGRTWRSGRVAANWSLEALFYPVFVLIQKSVNVVKLKPQQEQLKLDADNKTSGTTSEAPVIPNSDTAIVRLLEVVKKLPSRDTNSLNPTAEKLDYVKYHQQLEINDTVKAYLPAVQGIATHLGNKHLVLVTTDNKVLDILTLKQQQKLQDKIIAEVAEYWRLRHLVGEQVKNLSPEIDQLLHKLTGGETYKVSEVTSKLKVNTQLTTQWAAQSYISGLDSAIAYFESSALTVRQKVQQKLDMLNVFSLDTKIAQTSQNHNPYRVAAIRALINQAISYFFGQTTAKLGGKVTNIYINSQHELTTFPKLKQSIKQSTDFALDPWLTFDDLFGEELHAENEAAPQNCFTSGENQMLLSQYKASGQLVVSQKGGQAITQNQKKSAVPQQIESNILISNKVDNITSKQSSQKPDVEDKPEFIEISATSVGYEQHVLERILEWLDNLMLWLEDKFVRLLKLMRANISVESKVKH